MSLRQEHSQADMVVKREYKFRLECLCFVLLVRFLGVRRCIQGHVYEFTGNMILTMKQEEASRRSHSLALC